MGQDFLPGSRRLERLPKSLVVGSIVPALRKLREERGTHVLFLSEGARVPHPCVLCKGGKHGTTNLGGLAGKSEMCAGHLFAENAKQWGLHRGAVTARR
jgi:hypothetical protein